MSDGGADAGGRTWSRHYRRPYTVTGGRTRPAHDDLELETLVQTVTGIDEQLAELGREQRSIATLCREVASVAEIAGRLDLVLGVTRVIVADLALQGVVVLYRPQATGADADLPPVRLLAVVLLVGCPPPITLRSRGSAGSGGRR
jgi:ribosomal protein S25